MQFFLIKCNKKGGKNFPPFSYSLFDCYLSNSLIAFSRYSANFSGSSSNAYE